MPGALPPLWTHGDWHASNLLWRTHDDGDTEVGAVFDFGLCDRNFAMFDLATAIERNLIPWLNLDAGQRAQPQLEQLDALLDGYSRHCTLGAVQLRQLVALLPIVHADFALSEIDYFAGITRSADNADIAYHRYLLGHADWFASADGQRLLDHLHARAPVAMSAPSSPFRVLRMHLPVSCPTAARSRLHSRCAWPSLHSRSKTPAPRRWNWMRSTCVANAPRPAPR